MLVWAMPASDAVGLRRVGVGFAPARLPPHGQLRQVEALAAQPCPNLADFGAAVRGGQDTALVATGELSPFGGGRNFRIRRWRREGGMRGLHRNGPLRNSHDSHLPFYSN